MKAQPNKYLLMLALGNLVLIEMVLLYVASVVS